MNRTAVVMINWDKKKRTVECDVECMTEAGFPEGAALLDLWDKVRGIQVNRLTFPCCTSN